ncbi:tyrosine-type recombinase/integrase [Microbacterium sp. CJ77]|uniref:tyrosine-type recombinase/integrase n=1 Tax=Microbacterium sp. CJ77 TaxID=2079201 RepID=UPI0035BBEB28
MSSTRTPIGTFGTISFRTGANGIVRARTRYRDEDGALRQVQASGRSRKAAEQRLKVLLTERSRPAVAGELTPDTPFADLAELWLDDLDLEGRIAVKTRDLYEWNMRKLVLPAFGQLRLKEVTVSRVDRFLKTCAKTSYSRAKQAKNVLSLALGLAVRYDAIPRNPVSGAARLRKPVSEILALTVPQIQAIRSAVSRWRTAEGLPGPRPDGQLGIIIEVMLGTSARIGEVLAIRRCDVDVTVVPATVKITGTIVCPKGRPAFRQDHPKTAKSRRTVAVPSYTAAGIRQRLAAVPADGDTLLFCSRNGTPLIPNNIRRRLRTILEAAGIHGVTPHAFRRTVATVLDRASGLELAA